MPGPQPPFAMKPSPAGGQSPRLYLARKHGAHRRIANARAAVAPRRASPARASAAATTAILRASGNSRAMVSTRIGNTQVAGDTEHRGFKSGKADVMQVNVRNAKMCQELRSAPRASLRPAGTTLELSADCLAAHQDNETLAGCPRGLYSNFADHLICCSAPPISIKRCGTQPR